MAKPLAVLIVEDSESDAQLIVRLLKKAGYEITSGQVETAAQMRAALEKQAWDVVISDYSLPEFDGHAALMLLRETGLDIPFIAVSGTMGEETAVDMMRAGAHDYVMKGNLARLVPAVERELIQAEVRRERRRAEAALRESEERYRQIIETAQEGVWTVDTAGRTTLVNQRVVDMLGYTTEEMMGKPADAFLDKEEIAIAPVDFGGRQQGINKQFDFKFKRKDGSAIWALVEASALLDRNHHYMGALSMLTDITERKQAEEKLRETNEILQALVQASPVSIVALDLDGNVKKWNPASERIFGWSEAEVLGRFLPYVPQDKLDENEALRQQALGGKSFTNLEVGRLKKDGSPVLISLSIVPLHDGNGKINGIMGVNIDITERKRAEEALRESEQRYRQIIETAQEGIWTVDTADRTTLANQRLADMLGYTVEEMLGKPVDEFLNEEGQSLAPIALENRQQGINKQLDFKFKRKDGSAVWTLVKASTLLDHNQQYMGALTMLTDITERKKAEEALQESEARFRSYIEPAPLGVFIVDRLGRYLEVNAAATEMLGYTEAEFLHLSIPDILAPQSLEAGLQQFQAVVQGDFATSEFVFRRKDGAQFWAMVDAVKLSEDRFMSYCQDITERKQAEEKLSNAREFLQSVQDALSMHIAILDDQGNIVQVNSTWRDFGARNGLRHPNHCIGMNYLEVCDSAQGPYAEEAPLVANAIREVCSGGKDEMWVEYPCHAPTEQRWFIVRITSFENNGKKWVVVAHANTTERKQAEEEIRQRLSELEVLYQSGLAFSQLITPKAIAQKMIDLLDQEMDWHHTVIRLYHPESETLELLAFNVPYLNSREERSAAEERFKDVQRLDQGLSGLVVQQARVVRSNDLRNEPRYFETFPGLQSGLYAPIKIGERVIGEISIESEQTRAFSESDERLVITLAAQAAIAMDNAQLFESLKRSNIDLASAYDATIEGWSRALDLRDKETEGHSLRVTEMTIKLARALGLGEEELVHVRWGALLHDIGKMGVPDGILLKPGPLTDEEWVVMKKHPALAYEMLSPIGYLRPALDIPYCHHEKWDGSGYPRGLKDTQIPLVARIFAIVDVWDALSSDRPYRARWAKEKVDEHIRSSSGAHFDPQVVDVFMQMPH